MLRVEADAVVGGSCRGSLDCSSVCTPVVAGGTVNVSS